jgi:hypothetical protein
MNTFSPLKNPIKLTDRNERHLIGLLYVPDSVAESLSRCGEARVLYVPHFPAASAVTHNQVNNSREIETVYFFWSTRFRDAVILLGREPDKMNDQPGFWFQPLCSNAPPEGT